ncbi:MAG: flagellin, partial [Alphaproteobacteria bacterium]|nr:flagellin [Alphaproteobacteria bacterium]
VSKLTDALNTGIGNLVDANMAQESAQLTALQTKQQLGVQALSIANQSPQIIMSLFR